LSGSGAGTALNCWAFRARYGTTISRHFAKDLIRGQENFSGHGIVQTGPVETWACKARRELYLISPSPHQNPSPFWRFSAETTDCAMPHMTAVSEALEEAERCSAARVRQNGANEDRSTGNMVIAVYQHDASRELDPQLHTHAVAANLTYDGVEGRWKALQARGIYARRAYISEVYRNALAREMLRLGYGIESQRDSRGRDCGFEIAGLPGDLLRRFSQRSRPRDEAAREFETEHGRPPTDNEIAVLVRESRADTLVQISTEELRAHQRARLTPEDIELLGACKSEQPRGGLSRLGRHFSMRKTMSLNVYLLRGIMKS
jgi:hypothetical protein